MYYACLRLAKDKKDKNDNRIIIKKEFVTREEARAYIASVGQDPEQANLYDQFWTE